MKCISTPLNTARVDSHIAVVHVPGIEPDKASSVSDDDKIKAFSFMVARTAAPTTLNPKAAANDIPETPKTPAQNIFIYFADGKSPYRAQTTRVDDGFYVINFNGDNKNPNVKIILLTSALEGETTFKAFLLHDEIIKPDFAQPAPARTSSSDDNRPVFDMTNPAHPMHPSNPLNPANPQGLFAPRPSNGGK